MSTRLWTVAAGLGGGTPGRGMPGPFARELHSKNSPQSFPRSVIPTQAVRKQENFVVKKIDSPIRANGADLLAAEAVSDTAAAAPASGALPQLSP